MKMNRGVAGVHVDTHRRHRHHDMTPVVPNLMSGRTLKPLEAHPSLGRPPSPWGCFQRESSSVRAPQSFFRGVSVTFRVRSVGVAAFGQGGDLKAFFLNDYHDASASLLRNAAHIVGFGRATTTRRLRADS